MSIARHKLQGPRGRMMTPGAIPQPKRRRTPLIDIAKIDAEARATNARLPQQPEPADEPDPVEDQAQQPTTENHAESLQGKEQGSETETLQGQEVATSEPQETSEAAPEALAAPTEPASDSESSSTQPTTTTEPKPKRKQAKKTTTLTN